MKQQSGNVILKSLASVGLGIASPVASLLVMANQLPAVPMTLFFAMLTGYWWGAKYALASLAAALLVSAALLGGTWTAIIALMGVLPALVALYLKGRKLPFHMSALLNIGVSVAGLVGGIFVMRTSIGGDIVSTLKSWINQLFDEIPEDTVEQYVTWFSAYMGETYTASDAMTLVRYIFDQAMDTLGLILPGMLAGGAIAGGLLSAFLSEKEKNEEERVRPDTWVLPFGLGSMLTIVLCVSAVFHASSNYMSQVFYALLFAGCAIYGLQLIARIFHRAPKGKTGLKVFGIILLVFMMLSGTFVSISVIVGSFRAVFGPGGDVKRFIASRKNKE